MEEARRKIKFFLHGRNSEQIQAARSIEWSSAVNTDGLEGKYIGQVTVKITAMEITVKIMQTKTSSGVAGGGIYCSQLTINYS